jgi:phosphonate transport system substrate-binding protein
MASSLVAKEHLKFGIVPQSSGSKLAQLWMPILSYLENKTGYELEFATTRNIPTFEQRLHDGKYDIAYMNPYHYTKVNSSTGYQAFARAKDKRLQGIIVVQKDSPYRELKDLAGGEIAFPSNAFAADQVPRAYFAQLGISITPKFVASHDSVYRNVAKGRYPAGGGVLRTFNSTSKEFRDNLRILWTSEKFTPHAFAAHPRVHAEAVQHLQQAMLDMEHDPQGQKLLKAIQIKAIEPGVDKDWDDVRGLKIED